MPKHNDHHPNNTQLSAMVPAILRRAAEEAAAARRVTLSCFIREAVLDHLLGERGPAKGARHA